MANLEFSINELLGSMQESLQEDRAVARIQRNSRRSAFPSSAEDAIKEAKRLQKERDPKDH